MTTLPAIARRGSLGGALGALLSPIREGAALAIGVDAVTFLLAAAVPASAGVTAFGGPFGNAHSQAIWQAQVPLGVMLGGWLAEPAWLGERRADEKELYATVRTALFAA